MKKSKCKRNVKDWLKGYRGTLLVMEHYVWFMMRLMLFSVQLYIRQSIADYYILPVSPILFMHSEPADLSIIYSKHSLYWSRRGQAPHSFLVTVLSPKAL
jgi:hypothetical protein